MPFASCVSNFTFTWLNTFSHSGWSALITLLTVYLLGDNGHLIHEGHGFLEVFELEMTPNPRGPGTPLRRFLNPASTYQAPGGRELLSLEHLRDHLFGEEGGLGLLQMLEILDPMIKPLEASDESEYGPLRY